MLRYQLHKNAYFRAVVQRLATIRRFVHSPVIEKSVAREMFTRLPLLYVRFICIRVQNEPPKGATEWWCN